MKKFVAVLISVISCILLFLVCFDYNEKDYPNEYYNVYLDGKYLGTILSKEELEKYIDEKTSHIINIKNITKTYCEDERTLDEVIKQESLETIIEQSESVKYYKKNNKDCVDIEIKDGTTIENIYTPNGLEIEKILTYKGDLNSIEEVYSKIAELKSFTVKGYEFKITDEDKISYVNVIEKDMFKEAVTVFIETYVGKNEYKAYLDDSQLKIETVGSLLENVYIQENITFVEKDIPIDTKIYTDSNELAQFLLYGSNPISKLYTVKEGEMISDIALANEISSQEFLISNPKYRDENSLITVGTQVSIKQTNPQLKVVVEKYVVEDKVNEYETIYQYDDTQYIGYTKVSQEGENGLVRVKQRLKIINGNTVYVEPKGKETLKPSVDEIIIKGDKFIPNVGDLNNWAWPSESGWTSTSGYEWRIHPITGVRHFHYGLDIGGTGYNSAIYAANNGTVIIKTRGSDYGYYIVIDHNNGYYTLYSHMNKFYEGINVGDTVMRGQQIGYVGSTGTSTGPHIHFELWKNCRYCRINPWTFYR